MDENQGAVVVVPRQPTQAMIAAWESMQWEPWSAEMQSCWEATLAAAPSVDVQDEIACLREALAFYADLSNYGAYPRTLSDVQEDYGVRARKALGIE